MLKSDIQLKQDIEAELSWDPTVNAAQIGVSVNGGAVSLFGAVDTNAQKWAAEDAAKRVCGVCAIAQDLTVKLLSSHARTDSDIAAAIQNAIEWDVCIPNTVTATVHYGVVMLEGEVSWNYERDAAERAIRNLAGVVTVHNSITLKPQTLAGQVTGLVEAALQRHGATHPASIQVVTLGSEVTLSGNASSWQAIVDAENAAWAAPGVTQVFDRVKLSP